jgi:hypothetical protein
MRVSSYDSTLDYKLQAISSEFLVKPNHHAQTKPLVFKLGVLFGYLLLELISMSTTSTLVTTTTATKILAKAYASVAYMLSDRKDEDGLELFNVGYSSAYYNQRFINSVLDQLAVDPRLESLLSPEQQDQIHEACRWAGYK